MTGTRALVAALLACGLAALAPLPAEAGIFRATSLPRSTLDRPDDFAGLQVHVIYAVPSDGVDRAFDTSGGIESSTASYQTWLAGQTGGRVLRFDTFQGSLDITFQRLPRPDAEYVARGRGARDLIEQVLRTSGRVTWQKVYPSTRVNEVQRQRPRWRAITIRWTSLVPSPISRIF